MNVGAFLERAVGLHPGRVALRYGAVERTYVEFMERAMALGGTLRHRGLEVGDRVAFALYNRPEVLETMLGSFAAGLTVVPLNARLHPEEMAYVVANSGAKVFVYDGQLAAAVSAHASLFGPDVQRLSVCAGVGAEDYEELLDGRHSLDGIVEVDPGDPCWLFYTSGTTGRPKGAILSHRTIRVQVMNYLADVYNIDVDDVLLHVAPLSHGSGLVALPGVARAAENIMLENTSFDPKTMFAAIEQYGVTHVAFMAPTQIVRCLQEFAPGEWDLGTLRAVCYGGAPIYVEHLRQAVEAFGPVFVQIYGQAECPITATCLPAKQHAEFVASDDPRLGSAGFRRTDVEVRVVDEEDRSCAPGESGEVVVRGDVVMSGYWADEVATAETLRGGWLHTGDIGTFDDSGYLFLLDRKKDVVITGGNNVYPTEVESVLITHPSVDQVVVVGIPDPYWGEAVHAVVVPASGASPSQEELIAHCALHLAGYKKPKSVEFVAELPVSAYGKILRREVRDRYWTGLERHVAGGGRLT